MITPLSARPFERSPLRAFSLTEGETSKTPLPWSRHSRFCRHLSQPNPSRATAPLSLSSCFLEAAKEEERWIRETQNAIKEQRVAEARELARKEKSRKAELFGAEEVYTSVRAHKAPHVPVPKLLRETREEEAAARAAGMAQSAPKQYQFIKESLDALEAKHAAADLAAREKAYDRNRRRLKVRGRGGGGGGEEEEEEEEEDLRTKLSKMTDEEFKASQVLARSPFLSPISSPYIIIIMPHSSRSCLSHMPHSSHSRQVLARRPFLPACPPTCARQITCAYLLREHPPYPPT